MPAAVAAGVARAFIGDVFRAQGLPAADAARIAELMTERRREGDSVSGWGFRKGCR